MISKIYIRMWLRIMLLIPLSALLSLGIGCARKNKNPENTHDMIRKEVNHGDPITPYVASNMLLLRTDRQRHVKWVRDFGSSRHNRVWAGIAIHGGGFAFVCESDCCTTESGLGCQLIVADSEGIPLWDRCYYPVPDNCEYEYHSMIQLTDGRFVVTGSCAISTKTWALCVSEQGDRY